MTKCPVCGYDGWWTELKEMRFFLHAISYLDGGSKATLCITRAETDKLFPSKMVYTNHGAYKAEG